MYIFDYFRELVFYSFKKLLLDLNFSTDDIKIETILDKSEVTYQKSQIVGGDITTNISLVAAKFLNMQPVDISEKLKDLIFLDEYVSNIIVSQHGFINIFVTTRIWHDELREMFVDGIDYGISNVANGKSVNIEFASINPTGPMHVGHLRGAVIADILANVYIKYGYNVVKEYYVNDVGEQMSTLVKSVNYRYQDEINGVVTEIPEGCYPGDYLITLAKELLNVFGASIDIGDNVDFATVKNFSVDFLLNIIKGQLEKVGIRHDCFVYESSLHKEGSVQKTVDFLKSKNLINVGVCKEAPQGYAPSKEWKQYETLMFVSSVYGDDQDRVLQKKDGSWTYFASDIAYHYNKLSRNFDEYLIFLGEDHKGYSQRLKAAFYAMSLGKKSINVNIFGIVNFIKDGLQLKMSKRNGNFLTVEDILEYIDMASIRFILASRRADIVLDFDFDKAKEQNKNNSVFYVQYAYVRAKSVLKQAGKNYDIRHSSIEENIASHEELSLISKMARLPVVLKSIIEKKEIHYIVYFAEELAEQFHKLWHSGITDSSKRFITDNKELTSSRLYLLSCFIKIMDSIFGVLGIVPLEKM